MNLDLFLVQKVVQSLFQNDANATLTPLQTSPKKIIREKNFKESKEGEGEGEGKEKERKRKIIKTNVN